MHFFLPVFFFGFVGVDFDGLVELLFLLKLLWDGFHVIVFEAVIVDDGFDVVTYIMEEVIFVATRVTNPVIVALFLTGPAERVTIFNSTPAAEAQLYR